MLHFCFTNVCKSTSRVERHQMLLTEQENFLDISLRCSDMIYVCHYHLGPKTLINITNENYEMAKKEIS